MDADIYLDFRSPGAVNFMPDWKDQRMPDGFRDLDPQAIGPIYDKYSRDVYRYVRYRLNDDHVAEDIAGDVFLNLLEAFRKGRGPNLNIRAWLLSTAAHMVTDHLRRAYRRPTESMPDDVLDPGPTPGDEFESREESRDFRRAYALLTDEQQHVLALRFGEGYSLEETAAALNKKINAVKALQFRALASLQRNIGGMASDE
jgi:RNA polymerase sigma-70 factor (ECF subfamily)